MRLGCVSFAPQSEAEIDAFCTRMDVYGVSAVVPPDNLSEMTIDDSAAFGSKIRAKGLVLGEAGCWINLLTVNEELRARRIQTLRKTLINADAMGCRSVASMVGSRASSDIHYAPHWYSFTKECREEFREIVLRVLDGLDLKCTRFVVEPYYNTFLYQPDVVYEFIEEVSHPKFGVHLDQANMIEHRNFFETTALIERTFDLLSGKIVSIHLKDYYWETTYLGLHWRDAYIGDGTLDFHTLLRRVSSLDPDMCCYCEHFSEERDYAVNFARLHKIASDIGVIFKPRSRGE